ncbi:hypothetical protein HY837_00605 [archaeon]|nr:hypothetical protein [archaeon]
MNLELKLSEQEKLAFAFKLQNYVSLDKENLLTILYEKEDCSYDGGMKLFPSRDSLTAQVKDEILSKLDFNNASPELQKGLINFLLHEWHKIIHEQNGYYHPLDDIFLPFPKTKIQNGEVSFDSEQIQKINLNDLIKENDITLNFSEDFLRDIGKTPFSYVLDVFKDYVKKEVDRSSKHKLKLAILGGMNNEQLVELFFDRTIRRLSSNELSLSSGLFFLSNIEVTRRYVSVLEQEKFLKRVSDIGLLFAVNQELCKEMVEKKEKDDSKIFFQTIKELKVKKDVLEEAKYVYATDPKVRTEVKTLDPYRIGSEFLEDLIKIGAKFAKNDRHKEVVDLGKQIIIAKKLPKEREFRSVLSKTTKTRFSQILDVIKEHEQHTFLRGVEISKYFNNIYGNVSYTIDSSVSDLKTRDKTSELTEFNTKQFNVFDVDKNTNILELIKEELEKGNNPTYLAYRDMIASELVKILETAGKEHSEVYNTYKIFWERYVPYEYDLSVIEKLSDDVSKDILLKKYTFAIRKSEKPLGKAVKESVACLEEQDIAIFTEDEGTVNLIEYDEQNQPLGYVRFFLMKTNKGESALCLDTLEIGDKEFQQNNDHVRAMGLATIQLMLDSNVKYLFGEDSRVSYGLKQGFGDKYMKTKLQKLGTRMILANNQIRGPYSYMYDAFGNWKGETSMLALNWRLA